MNFVSPSELRASLPLGADSAEVTVAVENPSPGASSSASSEVVTSTATLSSAGRILDQSSVGPTVGSSENVMAVGIDTYLARQFAAIPTKLADLPATLPTACAANSAACLQSEGWIAVYSEAQVDAFARAFTGWTYAMANGGSPPSLPTARRTTMRRWPLLKARMVDALGAVFLHLCAQCSFLIWPHSATPRSTPASPLTRHNKSAVPRAALVSSPTEHNTRRGTHKIAACLWLVIPERAFAHQKSGCAR